MLAYEELKGSQGREIWYRPQRYEARQLFPNLPPRVRVGNHAFHIHNISLSGIATVAKQSGEDVLEVGETVPLAILQSGLPIFECDARVCRKENTVFGSKIAFNFLNHFVEFDKLLNRNAQAQIAARASLLSRDKDRLVSPDYRAFISDVLKVLRSYRAVLDSSRATASDFGTVIDTSATFEACEGQLVQQWRSLWRTGNELTRAIAEDRDAREASKEFTELVLTPEMRLGAIWDRSYVKPMGYPGDFQIMNQVYDWRRVGNNVYEMLMHRLGLEVAECIKTRMEVVRGDICNVVRARGQNKAARILSLGSGPAREVETYLAGTFAGAGRAEFTLIDQEQEALSYAYSKTYPLVLSAQGRARVQCLNMSFTDILRGTSGLGQLPPQDLVYSVGLLDYLTDRRAKGLVRRLYDQLAPGGLLIIGNMNETPLSNYWPMEYIADWTLAYRNEAQMLAWAEGLDVESVHTETEPTERVRLLYIRKK